MTSEEMANKRKLEMNWVGHCQGNFEGVKSDKIYVFTIRPKVSGEYDIVGKWGPRTNVKSNQVKSTVFNLEQAKVRLKESVIERLAKGYKDITDPSYKGPCKLTDYQKLFENEELGTFGLATEAKDIDFGLGDDDALVAECVNNTDQEDNFDVGVKYLVRNISKAGKKFKTNREAFKFTSLVGIEDKHGQIIDTSPKRFKLVDGSDE